MNKIFRVKWNAAQKRYDVTSELARGKTKSSCGSAKPLSIVKLALSSVSAILLAIGPSASAEELDIFKSTDGGHIQTVSSKQTLTSTNGWKNIDKADEGADWFTLQQLFDMGYLKGSGASYISDGRIITGNLVGTDFYDEGTGNTFSFKVYDNAQLAVSNLSNQLTTLGRNISADGQYVDRNLIQITKNGELDVNIGDNNSTWFNSVNNRVLAYMKGGRETSVVSSVFKSSSDDTSLPATLNFNSKTLVNLGNSSNYAKNSSDDFGGFNSGFTGAFSSAIGNQNVTNIAGLKAYNTSLIAALKRGDLSQDQYVVEFKKAFQQDTKTLFIDNIIPDTSASRQLIDRDRVAFILADGAGAIINIGRDAVIQADNSDISVVNLQNGSTLNNAGNIGTFQNSSSGSYVIKASSSSINNSGVIDAGTYQDMAGVIENGSTNPIGIGSVSQGKILGVWAWNSAIDNSGVINVAPRGNYSPNLGVQLIGNSTLDNTGSINASAAAETAYYAVTGPYSAGVLVNGTSTLTNKNMGNIYMGREAQRNTADDTLDIVAKTPNNRLVDLVDSGNFINENGGTLTLGSKTQGAIAVMARSLGVKVSNSGNININGNAAGTNGQAPLQNIGIQATSGASNIINEAMGVISLKGINALAMMAFSAGTDTLATQVTNKGTINIEGGVDPVTHTANYGLWAQGKLAGAINAGLIQLKGDGAIGAHARNGGTIQVEGAGHIDFDGKNQTGYYVLGAGSKVVDNSTASQNVTTEGSTLYRIDGGASFDGSGNASLIGASGKNSTALLVTSNGDASHLNSGDMTLAVSGAGATGIKVMGSAQGTLSDKTVLSLSGDGSSAGIVDGSYSDIVGNTSDYRGAATLVSEATLDGTNATGANVTGYIVRNGGTLDHKGSINFTTAGNTGVLVDGGVLNNSGSISVSGTAVNIQGMDSVVNNSGTVEATDGSAAFLVGDNAQLNLSGSGIVKAGGSAHGVLLDIGAQGLSVKDATIDMQPGGSSNAIENRTEIAGIQLDNTTINVGNGVGVRTAATLADTNSGTINVDGSGTGIYFGHADGSATSGDLDTAKSAALVINVNDAAGKGIVTNTSGNVKSGASVNVNDSAGGAALVVGGTTSEVEQSGILTSKSLSSAVIDVDNGRLTSFINRGDIIANSAAQEAIKVTLGSNIDFTNASGGNIVGRVDLSDGNNRVTLKGGSTATDVITGSGDDSYFLNDISASDSGLFTSLQAGGGVDTLNLNNASLTVTDPTTLTGFEKVSLSLGSVMNLSNTLLPLGDAENDGADTYFKVSDTSTLKLTGSTDTAFASHITGDGTLATDLAGKAFDFTANNASNSFSGTLGLSNATFALAGQNTQALSGATLRADGGGFVTVGTGTQNIGGLAFDGGVVKFDTGTPGHLDITTTIAAQQLDLSGHGTVEISAGTVDNDPVLPPDRLSVLEQDDSGIEMQLAISAAPAIGDGGNLVLKDQNGNIITDALTREVEQNGVQVASATYDYRLTSGANSDGLYVNYGLTQLDLQGTDGNALSLNAAGKSGNAADLSAKLTGSGDLAIGGGHVTLSNMDNDYQGKTFIRSGSLSMLNDNVLGNTSELAMSSGTGFDMNGHAQTVGAVNSASGSLIDLDGGDLTIGNGGTLDGSITGAGTLNLGAGLLNVNGANGSLTAVTHIASGAQALLNNTAGLGQGGIVTDGILGFSQAAGQLVNKLSGEGDVQLHDGSDLVLTGSNGDFAGRFTLDKGTALSVTAADSLGTASVSSQGALNILTNADWTLSNSVSGSGSLNKNGGGIMTLSQNAAGYTGTTAVNGGGLLLGTADAAVTLASAQTDVAEGALFGGFGGTKGSVDNAGTFVVGAPTAGSRTLPAASTFSVGGNLTNSGSIRVGQPGSGIAGNNLNVAGNYHGDGGRIHFNTALGGDNSLTDHMTVNGDTSGTTAVSVSNAGGLGGKTLNGIELITVKGASDGEFTQDGRIVAGAYDYLLARGKGENAGNWYLTSGSDGPVDPVIDPGKEEVVLITRPESGAYASNMAAQRWRAYPLVGQYRSAAHAGQPLGDAAGRRCGAVEPRRR